MSTRVDFINITLTFAFQVKGPVDDGVQVGQLGDKILGLVGAAGVSRDALREATAMGYEVLAPDHGPIHGSSPDPEVGVIYEHAFGESHTLDD